MNPDIQSVGVDDDSGRSFGVVDSCVLVGFHVLGTAVVAVAMGLCVLGPTTASQVLGDVVDHPTVLAQSTTEMFLHVGLAACLWAMAVILYSLVGQWRRDAKLACRARLERVGSVVTETLIVMPVLLLLVFGLAQLAVNNIAATLANLAAFNATRSAWVWSPEVGQRRAGQQVSDSDVEEHVRIAAALVMTPVAPGDFIEPGATSSGGSSFGRIHQAMYASGHDDPPEGNSVPLESIDYADSFSAALDRSDFDQRIARKFLHAYQSVDNVKISDSGGQISVQFDYYHFQAFPIVRRIFGDEVSSSSRVGYLGVGGGEYYTVFHPSMSMPAQTALPNPKVPDQE